MTRANDHPVIKELRRLKLPRIAPGAPKHLLLFCTVDRAARSLAVLKMVLEEAKHLNMEVGFLLPTIKLVRANHWNCGGDLQGGLEGLSDAGAAAVRVAAEDATRCLARYVPLLDGARAFFANKHLLLLVLVDSELVREWARLEAMQAAAFVRAYITSFCGRVPTVLEAAKEAGLGWGVRLFSLRTAAGAVEGEDEEE